MIGHKFETQNFGLYFIAGAMYRRKRWSLGISMKYGSSLKDSTQLTYDSIVADQSSDETKKAEVVSTATNLNSFKEKNPLTIRLGASSQLAKSLLITADIIYHSAVSDSGGDERFNLNSTINLGGGIELKLGSMTLRSGVFTDNSMFPKVDPNKIDQIPLFEASLSRKMN